jgi:hypothetical protein
MLIMMLLLFLPSSYRSQRVHRGFGQNCFERRLNDKQKGTRTKPVSACVCRWQPKPWRAAYLSSLEQESYMEKFRVFPLFM